MSFLKIFHQILKQNNTVLGIFLETFDEWKGQNDQTDDVLVVGIRV